tara:strand:- start:3123 stop:4631 length:1509 start_codon:yes stop_codon:yes gene_type:complete
MKIKKICDNCNNVFEVEFKSREKKYCNRTCYFEYAKKSKTIGRKKDEDKYETRVCVMCDSDFEVRKKVVKKLCSDECRKEWGVISENKEKRINKSKESYKEKYGVESSFHRKDIQDKIKVIIKEKYGVSHQMHHQPSVDKLKNTVREKHILTLLPKLEKHNLRLLGDYTKNKNTDIPYIFLCLKCDNKFTSTVLGSGKIPICRKCNPTQKNSSLEMLITDFLIENSIEFVNSDRKVLGGKEIDILIPSKGIGIEVNGNYWHTELFGGKDKKYHINKTKEADKKGIGLIHIYEDEVLFKKDIVFSRLRSKLGLITDSIFARKCEIREVCFKDKKIFLMENHIQGNSIDKIRLGLFYGGKLVSLMTFSKLRGSLGHKSNDGSWELNRFCSLLNFNVVGGFSKLLNYFIKNNEPEKIITYSDIRWSGIKDNVYENSTFKYVNITTPNYWYVKKGQYLHRHHRYSFRKDVLVKEGFSGENTEWEIMQKKEYDRLWDCGNMKYEIIF